MLPDLRNKNANIGAICESAVSDTALLQELVEGLDLKVSIKSGEETVRYNCYKALMQVSNVRPSLLLPWWDRLADMLRSPNSYHRMASVQLLANLAAADTEGRFETIFDQYYDLLDDESVIVATYVASCSGRIVSTRPELESRVTKRLLGIENTHHAAGRKALIVAGAIETFAEYMEWAGETEAIVHFVRRNEGSASPKTRKLARTFLKRWGR